MNNLIRPTLVLGLGGTGYLCVSRIKSIYKQSILQKDREAIKFLAVDFDDVGNNSRNYVDMFGDESPIDEKEEFVKVSSTRDVDYERDLRNPQSNADMRYFESDSVKRGALIDLLRPIDLHHGAGQKRVLGKVGISYSSNYNRVKSKLENTLRPLTGVNFDGVGSRDTITVYMFNSFSGGAGAGMYLDVIFLLNDLRVDKPIEIITFNVLPEVYEGMENTYPRLLEPNAYAAVTELEYIYSDVENFIPTNQNHPLGTSEKLPVANFLIGDKSNNGAVIGYRSIIHSISKTAIAMFSSGSGSGLEAQWSNFGSLLEGEQKGKRKIFCSFGYSEVIFRPGVLEDYCLRRLLAKSWRNYNKRQLGDDQEYIEKISELLNDVSSSFLRSDVSDPSNADSVANIVYQRPLANKSTAGALKTTIEVNKNSMQSALESAVKNSYDATLLVKIVNEKFEEIRLSTLRLDSVEKSIDKVKDQLRQIKKLVDIDIADSEELDEVLQDYNKDLVLTTVIPKPYRNWFGVKGKYYSEYLKNAVNRIQILIDSKLKNLIVEIEIKKLLSVTLTECIEFNASRSQKSEEKISWINKHLKERTLTSNFDNTIYLEAYFTKEVDRRVEEFDDDNSAYIKNFLSNEDVQFQDLIRNTEPMLYIRELGENDIYELKSKMEESDVNEIVSKLEELINPLWSRANENVLSRGSANSEGNIVKFTTVELPNVEDSEKDYFGKAALFQNREVELYSTDKHRQSIIHLELGLAAFHVNNLKRYKEKYDIQLEENRDKSVLYFAYNDIRKKCLLGECGIYVFDDEEDRDRTRQAIFSWALGWALDLIFVDQNRIKIVVSEDFVVPDSKKVFLGNRVYDMFKDIKQTTDLVQIFNALKDDDNVVEDLHKQIEQIRARSPLDFLNKINNQFARTNVSDPNQKFRTQKKSISQYTESEKRLVFDDEEQTLVMIAQETADQNKFSVDIVEDQVGRARYKRLRVD